MAKIQVHSARGFLEACEGTFTPDLFSSSGTLQLKTREHKWNGEKIPTSALASVEYVDEKTNVRGMVGMGALGGLLLGPIGLLAAASKLKNPRVKFVAKFKDDREIVATTDASTFRKLQECAAKA